LNWSALPSQHFDAKGSSTWCRSLHQLPLFPFVGGQSTFRKKQHPQSALHNHESVAATCLLILSLFLRWNPFSTIPSHPNCLLQAASAQVSTAISFERS